MTAHTALLLATLLPLVLGVPGGSRTSGDRIVGGVNADPGEYPYQVTLQQKDAFGSLSHKCAGAILNESYVITAAQCINRKNPANFVVIAGEHDFRLSSGDEQQVLVESFIPHEHYDASTITNDIGLVKLATPLVFNSVVGPLQLPAQLELTANGTLCNVTGWGVLVEGGQVIPPILKEVEVPIVDDATCRAAYGITAVGTSMVCAGYPEGGKDSCSGDGGDPLVCEGILTGIASWGNGCGRPGFPGVYTEVAYYRNWIDTNAV